MRARYFDDPQDATPKFHCDKCGGELYDYDDCFVYGSTLLCENCTDECDDEYDWVSSAYKVQDYYRRIYGGNES